MKFVVQRTKSGFFENEYDVRLAIKEKTKNRLRIAVLGLSIIAPTAYIVMKEPASPETKNDPETLESP